MKIHLSSDEVNLLVYRYLVENGFVHTAYAFLNEGNISKNTYYVSHCDKLPSNALVSFLQKALIYIYIEYHTDHKDGKKISCEEPFSFFRRHECWNDENNSSEDENKAELQLNDKISSNNLNSFGTSNNSNNRNNDDSNNSSSNYNNNNNTKNNNNKNNNNDNDNNNNNNPKENTNSQKPKVSRPHIYSSSFSNFASLNYNDSNLSFKDIKRNYVSIFAQAKTAKKRSNKKTNNNDELKEKNVKEESNSTSGNQKKKSKAIKSSGKSNKVTESDNNNKSEDGDGNFSYDKKKKKT
ncbi:conserved Plasmodium protein, unknown function [Plasmodium chabaudi adami]|uniref:Uncharacterized protein n=1 Tax=Plasmodium chabaudi adami TaxID=5826 RepID=A0A1C6YM52_PLACE|nr:conserved Plasmodium protein, unknown function [Plasmodium chabaudi adami]